MPPNNINPFFTQTSRTNLSAQRIIDEKIQGLNSSTNVTSFPPDVPKYYTFIIENDWTVLGSLSGTLFPRKGYRLPLPFNIIDNHQVHYDHNFNWLSVLNLANGAGGVGGVFGAGIGALGFQLNNFKHVTLASPEFRQFTLEWKLIPKNYKESELIREIYLGIKKGMHPLRKLGSLVFEFPKIYWVGFFPNAGYLFKFKPAVISGCQIDYQGGNQQPAFYKHPIITEEDKGGPPESIIIRLSFIELEYWIDTDFNNAKTDNPFDSNNWYSLANSSPVNISP